MFWIHNGGCAFFLWANTELSEVIPGGSVSGLVRLRWNQNKHGVTHQLHFVIKIHWIITGILNTDIKKLAFCILILQYSSMLQIIIRTLEMRVFLLMLLPKP